jgi:hypothetical protein
MAVYLANTGLECLLKDGSLDQKQMLAWFEKAKRIPTSYGFYATKVLQSGLTIVFRVLTKNNDTEIAGVDMHMSGRCVWSAKPLVRIGEGEALSITLLMTNPSEKSAFIATLVHAATLEQIDEDTILNVQVCAFPQALDAFDSRQAYEAATDDKGRLEDKKLLPFNYIMARDESLSEEDRQKFAQQERMVLLCGPVLDVQERMHGYRNTKCMVATIATQMGHLDLVFSANQLSKPLQKGSYVVASCAISADVLAD